MKSSAIHHLFYVLLVIACVNCLDLFDYSDVQIDEPISYLWNNRDNLIQESYAPCVSTINAGSQRDGTCMHGAECKLKGGKYQGRGKCGFWQTCCYFEKTCNATSKARVSYFVNPNLPRMQQQPCAMRVEVSNDRVCQMRVDIIEAVLADPVAKMLPSLETTCTTDRIVIEAPEINIKYPDICGQNYNQHFYIHMNKQQQLHKAINFKVYLESRTDGTIQTLVNPRWNIKVTQLECPMRTKKFAFELQSKNKNQVNDDFDQLAPEGCLQYFTERSGIIKSFGYVSNTEATLTTNNDYAICFKRSAGSCGVSITKDDTNSFLRLRANDPLLCGDDEYLYIPEVNELPTGKVCSGTPAIYNSYHPGPLYVHFFTKKLLTLTGPPPPPSPLGFYLQYDTNVPC